MPSIDTDRELDRLESWLPDHREAMACRDLEEAISRSLEIEACLWERERKLRDLIFANPQADLSDLFDSNNTLLNRLNGVMGKLLSYASLFRSRGHEVERLQDLHDSFVNLFFALMPDEEFFAGDWLEKRGLAAVEEADRGETEPMKSFSE